MTVDAMTDGFVCAMLWADAEPIGMDPDVGERGGLQGHEPTPALRSWARSVCDRFYTCHADDVHAFMDAFGDPDGGHPGEYVGHTLYLDAAGHGVSFTDDAWRADDPMTAVCARLHVGTDAFAEVEHMGAYELEDGTVGLDRDFNLCRDCGRAITLQPSGWWTHDHAVNPTDPRCWRVSMDGPNYAA